MFFIQSRASCGLAAATPTTLDDGQPHLGRQWGVHFGLTQRGRVAQFVIHRRAPCGRAGATLTAQGDGQPHLGRQWGGGPGPDSGGRVMQLKKCLHYPKKGPLWTFCGDANRTGLWTTSIGMSMASALGPNSGVGR